MILFAQKKKALLKSITIALLACFLFATIAGAAESVICIGQDETHILEQEQYYLVACHTSGPVHTDTQTLQKTFSASEADHENSCIDVALTPYGSLASSYRTQKLVPKELPKVLNSSPSPFTAAYSFSATVTHTYRNPHTSSLRSLDTVILLI